MTRACLFAAALLLGTLAPGEAEAQSEKWIKRWKSRIAKFQRENRALPDDARSVVLLGSSSMEGWRYAKRVERFLPNVQDRVLNRGISGDGIGFNRYGLKNRMNASVHDTRPSHVFILNGRNSIGRTGRNVNRTAEVYRELIRDIKDKNPGVTVVVVTCPSVNYRYSAMARPIVDYNAKLTEIAAAEGCLVIDLHARMLGPDGLLPPIMTRDGLHFRDVGYRILGEEIERIVAETEAEPAAPEPEPAPEAEPPTEGATNDCPSEDEVASEDARRRMLGMLEALRRRLGF